MDELIDFLRPRYTNSNVKEPHLEIAKIGWQRVYTTNYDDVYEFACSKSNWDVQSIVVNQPPKDVNLSANDCVHINGYIKDLTRTTLHSAFKLTRTSYLTDAFSSNPWQHAFRSDVERAEAVFFIGYSLYDLDISRIIFATEQLQAKTFFVVSTTPGSSERR